MSKELVPLRRRDHTMNTKSRARATLMLRSSLREDQPVTERRIGDNE